jgi:hypothetical protein
MAYKFQLGTAILSGSVVGSDDDSFDLGSSTKEYKDLYLDGVAYVDELQASQLGSALDANNQAITNINVDSGDISGADVTVGSGKTLDVSAGTLTLAAGQVAADRVGAGTFDAGAYSFAGSTIANLGSVTSADINGGAIDGTVIGANSAVAGTFTTINGTQVTASVGFSGSLFQGTMANFGGGGLSTSDGGSIQSAGDISGSGDFQMGGTVRVDGAASLAAVNVDLTADSFYMLDDTDKLMKKVAMTDYASKIAGNAISVSNGVLAVNPDAAGGLEIRSGFDSLQIKALGVTNAMLSGSIANGKLANSSVSYGGISVSLGGSDATPAFDLADATNLPIASGLAVGSSADLAGRISDETGTGALVFATSPTLVTPALGTPSAGVLSSCTGYPGDSNLVTAGALSATSLTTADATITTLTSSYARITNLDVVTINSIAQTEETLEVSDKLIVSALSASSANSDGGGLRIGGGASSTGHASVLYDHGNSALDFNIAGTTRASVDAAGFDVVGALSASAGLLGSALTLDGTLVSSTAAEINFLDAGSAGSSVTVAGADSIIIGSAASTNATTKVLVSDIADFVGENIAEKLTKVDHTSTHSHVFATHGSILLADASSGAVTINLPALAAGNDGKILKVKKNGSNDVTINAAGSDLVDGLAAVVLASDNAAISIIFDNANSKYHII